MLDYSGIAEALAGVLRLVDDVKIAEYELDERSILLNHMPLIDVRPNEVSNEVRAGQDYFSEISYQCDLYTFSLSSAKEAAILRDKVLKDAQNAVRANPQFHVDLETSVLGAVELTSTKDEDSGTYTVLASFQVIAKAFTDRSS